MRLVMLFWMGWRLIVGGWGLGGGWGGGGPWAQWDGMVGQLGGVDRARLGRLGLRPLSVGQALALFDAACGVDDAVLVAAGLDLGVFARLEPVPALLRGLVRPAPRRAGAVGLVARLAGLSQQEG